MPTSQITQILNSIDSAVLILTIKIILILFLGLVFKSIAESIFAYFEFRSNKFVCIGRKVSVNGFEGVITYISPRFIIIENKDQSLLLPIVRWKYYNWKFFHNIDRKDSITHSYF